MAQRRHCRKCDAETLHDREHELCVAERLFFGTFTLGASEAMFSSSLRCQRCGYASKQE